MKKIVVFGAGKSSSCLIDYLVAQLSSNDWTLTVLDADLNAALSKTGNAPNTLAAQLTVHDEADRKKYVAGADIVISLLPPVLHHLVATDCLEYGKNLLTASYISPEIESLRPAITEKKLLFLCEMGLDPGIDHMSAMKIVHQLQKENKPIRSFLSHCGGLVAPENDDNPWHYKISWNPRNVIMAGKAGADFRENGKAIHLSYEKLFDPDKQVEIGSLGRLCYYPNRDSLSYIGLYGLEESTDFIRTTLRYPAFSAGWKKIIALGLTREDLSYDTNGKTIARFFTEHFKANGYPDPHDAEFLDQLRVLGKDDDSTLINKGVCNTADVLQFILETKLPLKPGDRDMIVMLHEITYTDKGRTQTLRSQLIVKGENNVRTAMAKTVGLPLGIAAKLFLHNKLSATGLQIPVSPEIYLPVLAELEKEGILFTEEIIPSR